ncbi:kinesin-like protein KIN-14L [Telopea speciosissima]|uniref:kinesin-like protein KIN-14L n=1 Tax=Telopea speciosissima TaxID=54955 RepID=UPI001CC65616|nr:kinesin-like protein KIN-14L [Telopea speciosissima]
MEDPSRMTTLHDLHLASRKAEEGACRRFEAAGWLETLVGPLGLSNQPSEQEFLSCLRNGIFLCNAINKIRPGAVPKVVEGHPNLLTCETQSLPAYQYFENVRNFLVAVEELKLPAFEASALERDALEVGSSSKVVDCILALKSYHDRKELGANGFYKHSRSPMVSHSASRIHSRASSTGSSDPCRRLDVSFPSENQLNVETERQKHEVLLVEALAQCLVDTKENVDQNLLASVRSGNQNSLKLFTKTMSSLLQEQHVNKFPELKTIFKDSSKEVNGLIMDSTDSLENVSRIGNYKYCKSCLKKGNCNHWRMLEVQENDLLELKSLLSSAKKEFELLQSQLQNDLKQIGNQVQELSTAAVGYQSVVKENRQLHNMVQDLKGNIRVYCRIRPTFNAESKGVVDFVGEDGSLVIVDPAKPQRDPEKAFHFNRVYGPTATQEEVFQDVKPLIRSVMDGYNVCIFAYGQTGSGKTHTMCGPSGGSMKDRGINYHALNDLFNISCKRRDIMDYDVDIQMVEIYNEQVRDLLVEDSSSTKLEIRTCTSNGGLTLPGATMYPVKSTGDVLNLMKLGELNRVVSSTALNNQSSRSHSILTVHVQGKDKSGSILRSCLHLVDLAGSERVDKSEVTGDRLKEAQHINKSLSCLGDVITALAQKNSHIPYRNSKLTQLLQDSLGGRAKTLMFAHVSPEADSYGETISTLKFAQRVSAVELGVARLNKESSEVRELREQVESLKKALARKEAQDMQFEKAKELRSHCEKPKVPEYTPPRNRRLSTESSNIAKAEKVMNQENRKGSKTPVVKVKLRTERTPTRSQGLSLEGPKYNKDQMQIRNSEDVQVSKRVQQYVAPYLSQDAWNNGCSYLGQCQNPEITSSGNCADDSSMTVAYHSYIPRSPNKSFCQSQTLATDSRMRIPHLQLPKTPEPQIRARNEVQIVPQRDLGLSNKSHTPSLNSSTSKKGSQIKKSLQNIGKLIHGSEKRNVLYKMETQSPIHGMKNINDGKSPLISSARAMRRQSLTGGQTLGMEKSRRSSLGGKSGGCHSNETRNARTPPPANSPTYMAKRWL